MNHWKKFGMKAMAGVLTAGMLLGQPSVLYASGSSLLSEVSETSETGEIQDENTDEAGTDTEAPGDSEEGGSSGEIKDPSGEGDTPGEGQDPSGEGGTPGEGQDPSGEGGTPGEGTDDPSEEGGTPEEPGETEGTGSSVEEAEDPAGDAAESALPETDQTEEENPEEDAENEEDEEEEEEESEEGKLQLKVPAGKSFYISQLSSVYHMSFSDDFGDVMAEIENENRMANGMGSGPLFQTELTASEDSGEAQAPNWNDVLAVYILEQTRRGETSFAFNRDHKDAIAAVYGAMNPVQNMAGELSYINFTVEDYEKQHEDSLTEEEISLLDTYMCMDCKLLTAATTGIRAFILGTMDETVSEDRANIVAAAYSLVGKISYFYGGYSTAIGWDSRWGEIETVNTEGTESYGTRRAYGLDCSGYVMWCFINGFGTASAMNKITRSSQSQWGASRVLGSDEKVLPGDLVFIAVPGTVDTNHVGLVIGVKENGNIIVAHCNSYYNGVTIEEASDAGFKYVRRPKCLESGDQAVSSTFADTAEGEQSGTKKVKVTLLAERDNVPKESDQAAAFSSDIQPSAPSESETTENKLAIDNIMQQ